jgi:Rieske 2Fe-2S family protein
MTDYRNSIEIGVGQQRTLEAGYYLSPVVFAQERDAIFSKRWVCVAREEDVPASGAFVVREVAGESLIVVRGDDGRVRAHFNVCRHRGTRLCTESSGAFARTIQCPYHAWTYALDGRLTGVPDEQQLNDFRRADYGLFSAGCEVWQGFVWVNLADQRPTAADWFAPLNDKLAPWGVGDLVRLGRRTYDVTANWKLIVQNYSECYHCPVIHPALVKLSPPTSGGNDLTDGPFLGGFMDVTEPGGSLTCSGRACGATVGTLAGPDLQRVYYYVVFPNLLLSLHHDYVMVHTLWPIAPDRTRIECEWLFHPDSRDSSLWNPADGIEFWDQTNREDWQVSELTQLGVASSRYQPGPYSNREAMVAAFDRYYLRVLNRG